MSTLQDSMISAHDYSSLVDQVAPPRRLYADQIKPMLDLVLAILLLVPTVPVLILVAIAVKLTSRGPVFYRQERVGQQGRLFEIIKVRTMIHDCEVVSGPRWSVPGDPRVTWVGQFLRQTHLDELPQLWNVIRGEMSLVGPRPERSVFVEQLAMTLDRYDDRHEVKPGVTGLAQILLPPDSHLGSVQAKLSYDLHYVDAPGPCLDFKILLGTAFKVIGVPFAATRMLLRLPALPPQPARVSGVSTRSTECSTQPILG